MAPAPLLEKSQGWHRGRSRAGPWVRVRVFLGRLRLDRALARGADPAGSPELGLRAQQLQRSRTREQMARGIDRLIDLVFADPRRHVGPAMLPFRYQRVRPNLGLLEELAEALRGPGPHAVKGLAMATTLLEDSRGPLYASDPPENLRQALDATISELGDQHDERSR